MICMAGEGRRGVRGEIFLCSHMLEEFCSSYHIYSVEV